MTQASFEPNFTPVNTLVYLKGGHVGALNSAHLALFGYPD
jgi:hypothetical protein